MSSSQLESIIFSHPQGCRSYLLVDKASREALALDVHLDFVHELGERIRRDSLKLKYVVDSHTHADHPSAAAELAKALGAQRVAHSLSGHAGVTLHPADGDSLSLGKETLTVRHAPGHTPDHLVLLAPGRLFSGDMLFIEGVARTDFLGGDAGQLFDSIHSIIATLPDETLLYPGHDYARREHSTLLHERKHNAWLAIKDRDVFIRKLTANPPPKPANMDDLLRLNREGRSIPAKLSAGDAIRQMAMGGVSSVIDVRTGIEFEGESLPGSRHIPLDQLEARIDEVRATPAPRLLLCQSGNRATSAKKQLEKLHVQALTVIDGGLNAYIQVGGQTIKGRKTMSLERQVRIVAGGLVLTGVLAGLFAHLAFLGISGFVGAGLMFAGITDWCGMGLLLARMPWNQSKNPGTCATVGTCAAAPVSAGGCAASSPGS